MRSRFPAIVVAIGWCLPGGVGYCAESVSPSVNRAPAISGTLSDGVVGGDYYFLPKASDPEGDALTFSISNAPGWMKFRASDGRITGQPDAAGTYSNIVISVRDSHGNTTSLPPATVKVTGGRAALAPGSATLSWTPPTKNNDSSNLANLAGYRIYYGTSPTALDRVLQIENASASSYTVTDLSRGKWYFAVRAYRWDGAESVNSDMVSKVIR